MPSRKGFPSRALAFALTLTALGAWATSHEPDRRAADAALAALAASPSSSALAREPIARARAALRRSDDARAAGDVAHAAELDALGREWAESGTDLLKAAEREREADDLEQRAHDTDTKTTRARALLEDTVARLGRAEEALKRLEPGSAGSGPAPAVAPAAAAPSASAAPAASAGAR